MGARYEIKMINKDGVWYYANLIGDDGEWLGCTELCRSVDAVHNSVYSMQNAVGVRGRFEIRTGKRTFDDVGKYGIVKAGNGLEMFRTDWAKTEEEVEEVFRKIRMCGSTMDVVEVYEGQVNDEENETNNDNEKEKENDNE